MHLAFQCSTVYLRGEHRHYPTGRRRLPRFHRGDYVRRHPLRAGAAADVCTDQLCQGDCDYY